MSCFNFHTSECIGLWLETSLCEPARKIAATSSYFQIAADDLFAWTRQICFCSNFISNNYRGIFWGKNIISDLPSFLTALISLKYLTHSLYLFSFHFSCVWIDVSFESNMGAPYPSFVSEKLSFCFRKSISSAAEQTPSPLLVHIILRNKVP